MGGAIACQVMMNRHTCKKNQLQNTLQKDSTTKETKIPRFPQDGQDLSWAWSLTPLLTDWPMRFRGLPCLVFQIGFILRVASSFASMINNMFASSDCWPTRATRCRDCYLLWCRSPSYFNSQTLSLPQILSLVGFSSCIFCRYFR